MAPNRAPMIERGARVLVIGGTRFIGRLTCEAALAAGAEVTLLHRGQTPAPHLAEGSVRHVYGDRHDRAALAQAFARDYDAVLDMIAYRAEDVAPLLTDHAARIGHLVVCSTTSVYAPALYQPIDEDHPRGPHPAWGGYNEGKNAVEDLLQGSSRVRATTLRPQWVFGPHDYQHLAEHYLARIAAGLPIWLWHPGVAQLNWTYGPDLAAAFLRIAGSPAAAPAYNVCCAETLTTLDWIALCGRVLGRQPDVRFYRPEDLPASLPARRIGPVRNLPLACSALRIAADAGFRPTPLEEAVASTASWLRTSGAFAAVEPSATERHLAGT